MRSPEFYANPDTRLFLSADRKAGVAVSSDGFLVSAFGPSADLRPILAAAAEHATRAYAYAVDRGAMLRLYSDLGFRTAARARFDLDYAPSGWSTAALGKPDLVFMVKDPQGRSGAVRIRGAYDDIAQRVPMAKSHDQALRWQAEAVRAVTIAPVSHALDIRVKGNHAPDVELGVSAVDQVHRDGALPRIPLEDLLDADNNDLGQFKTTLTGAPSRIRVRDVADAWPALTTVHEIGHFLDYWVLGKQGKNASHSHPDLQAFREAVDKSQAVKQLRKTLEGDDYLLERKELWARAYAQYIARKGGNSRLLEQVEKIREKEPNRQWASEDFAPIEKAIDKLFQKKGWLE